MPFPVTDLESFAAATVLATRQPACTYCTCPGVWQTHPAGIRVPGHLGPTCPEWVGKRACWHCMEETSAAALHLSIQPNSAAAI